MTNERFAVFDSDSHVVEPPELWSKYKVVSFRVQSWGGEELRLRVCPGVLGEEQMMEAIRSYHKSHWTQPIEVCLGRQIEHHWRMHK